MRGSKMRFSTVLALLGAISCGGETPTDLPPDDEPIVAAAVVVFPAGASISGVGTTQSFTAEVQDVTGLLMQAETVTWTSLNPEVATIDADGLATAVASGQVTVAAEANDLVGYALLTVSVPEATPVTSWSIVMSGESQGLYQALRGVWGVSPNDVYAVGGNFLAGTHTILHYDGTDWNMMRDRVPGGVLNAVWGTSPTDIYAVGGAFGGAAEIIHYDGTAWSVATRVVTNPLNSVWGAAPNDVYAVGLRGTIVHYDGTSWRSVDSGTSEFLTGVWGFSSSDIYAVGSSGAAILHYDGSSWRAMRGIAEVQFHAVWGSSSSDVYAVGGSLGRVTVVHYDGTGWSTIMDEVTGIDEVEGLQAVWGSSSSDIYTADEFYGIRHYDGVSWSPYGGGMLLGVWSSAFGDAYAVGIIHGTSRSPGGVILRGMR